jgi:hypothetical protein
MRTLVTARPMKLGRRQPRARFRSALVCPQRSKRARREPGGAESNAHHNSPKAAATPSAIPILAPAATPQL